LHESDEAKRVAKKWLAKEGLLANVGRLNELGLAMFNNIAPISPEMTLAAIEDELSGPNASELIRNDGGEKGSVQFFIQSPMTLTCLTDAWQL
jgi:hypothetical protein